MKILFVYPNILLVNRIPLGIAYLSAILKREGHEVNLFDTTFYKNIDAEGVTDDDIRYQTLQVKPADLSRYGVTWESKDIKKEFLSELKCSKPDIVMFTITENMFSIAEELMKISHKNGFFTMAGGILPTVSPHELINKPYLDAICVGEGEEAIVEFCRYFKNCEDMTSVRNIWIKKDGKVIENAPRDLYDINNLPFQDWELFSAKHIYRPLGGKVYRTGNFMISRGCPYGCAFCVNEYNINFYKGKGSYHRKQTPEKAITEIKHFKDTRNLELVNFHDEAFLLMPENYLDTFMRLYKEEIALPFSIVTRVNTVSDYKMRKIVDAGCINISMSIESGNPNIREKILKRKMSNESIVDAFRITKRYGIRVSTSNIIGIPHESRKEIFDTIELNRLCNPDSATVNMLYPYRGTSIREYCMRQGFIKGNEIGRGVRMGSILNLPTIDNDELLGIQRCFQFYFRFDKKIYPLIEKAEAFTPRGNKVFNQLVKRYKNEFPDAG